MERKEIKIELLNDIIIKEEIYKISLNTLHKQYVFMKKQVGNPEFLFTLDSNMFNKLFKIKS